jgi:hypothetical protein
MSLAETLGLEANPSILGENFLALKIHLSAALIHW